MFMLSENTYAKAIVHVEILLNDFHLGLVEILLSDFHMGLEIFLYK